MTQLQKELQAAAEAKGTAAGQSRSVQKGVLEQQKAREERLSGAEVELARTEQKEAYAAEQVQQLERVLRDNWQAQPLRKRQTKKRKALFAKK